MSVLFRYFNSFHRLTEEDRQYIGGFIKTVELQVGKDLPISEQAITYIENGLIKQVAGRGKSLVIRRFFKDGEAFIAGPLHADWRYEAIEPSTIEYIEVNDLFAMFGQYPRLSRVWNSLMARELSHRKAHPEPGYDADPLLYYKAFVKTHRQYLNRIPKKDIATYLGISRSVLKTVTSMDGLRNL